jgi:RNA 3'-terminal phosphate cyclase (ATP)
MEGMITIDGSFGEGGGQIVRSSLALSAVLGRPVRLTRIRAGRPKPGLANQHLAAARAVAVATEGRLEGASNGSTELIYEPGIPRAGTYSLSIGTAGSTLLVLQTLLPVLASAPGRSELVIQGGTHNPMAPPAHFVTSCYLPALHGLGFRASLRIERHGFYPEGGGEVSALVEPWRGPGRALVLDEEADWQDPEGLVLIANLPAHVAERESRVLVRELGIGQQRVKIEILPGDQGPGNVVMVSLRSARRTALFISFGRPGKRAEVVARQAARAAMEFGESRAAVDPFLADQILLPAALAAGCRFTTSAVTDHTRTHAELLKRFLLVDVSIEELPSGNFLITVPGTMVLDRARPPAEDSSGS